MMCENGMTNQFLLSGSLPSLDLRLHASKALSSLSDQQQHQITASWEPKAVLNSAGCKRQHSGRRFQEESLTDLTATTTIWIVGATRLSENIDLERVWAVRSCTSLESIDPQTRIVKITSKKRRCHLFKKLWYNCGQSCHERSMYRRSWPCLSQARSVKLWNLHYGSNSSKNANDN